MHTLEIFEEAAAVAERLGYKIRHEWMGGSGGGACEFGGQRWIFVDLALDVADQLDQIISALRDDQGIYGLNISPQLSRAMGIRKSA